MAQSNQSASGKLPVPAQTVRVTIAYRGQDLRLASRQTVTMRTLPSHELQVPEKQSGFWFQVEDGSGRVIYRRVMQNPIRYDTETISDDPQHPLMRVEVADPDGMFFLLVPLLREAQVVRVFSSPLEPHKDADPAVEILAFDLFGESEGGQEPSTGPGTQPNKPRRRSGKKPQSDEEADQDLGGEEA